jgi:hypothetical protein
MDQETFYEQCARLLGTQYERHEIRQSQERLRWDGSIGNNYRNRWNNRYAGNGRYPGRGIVRHFGRVIQVALYDPPLTGYFSSVDDALAAIELAVYKAASAQAHAEAKAVVQQAGVTVDPRIVAHRGKENQS